MCGASAAGFNRGELRASEPLLVSRVVSRAVLVVRDVRPCDVAPPLALGDLAPTLLEVVSRVLELRDALFRVLEADW